MEEHVVTGVETVEMVEMVEQAKETGPFYPGQQVTPGSLFRSLLVISSLKKYLWLFLRSKINKPNETTTNITCSKIHCTCFLDSVFFLLGAAVLALFAALGTGLSGPPTLVYSHSYALAKNSQTSKSYIVPVTPVASPYHLCFLQFNIIIITIMVF